MRAAPTQTGARLQRGMADAPGLRLQPFPRRLPADGDSLEVKRNAEGQTQIADEIGVGVGLRPQAVVDVDALEPEAERRCQGAQDVEERDGIGAA